MDRMLKSGMALDADAGLVEEEEYEIEEEEEEVKGDEAEREGRTDRAVRGGVLLCVFLVADEVKVSSKNDESEKQWVWKSKADGDFYIYEDPRGNTLGRGTELELDDQGGRVGVP
eukprot:Sspe_Gene.847::Locus_285_Transcript_9_9_Confidence_0.278_Length_2425::g.847::m.847